MMRAVVVKIPEDLIKDGQECASATRSAYICRAIEHFNRETESIIRAKKLAAAPRKVRSESMRVNAEFAAFEQDPDA